MPEVGFLRDSGSAETNPCHSAVGLHREGEQGGGPGVAGHQDVPVAFWIW